MSYLVLYKFPPETGIVKFLSENVKLTGLRERGLPTNVIHGHPLFVHGFNNDTPDKFFPVVGVEWVTDNRTESIGQNFREFQNNDDFRIFLQEYKNTPSSDRTSSNEQIDSLTKAERIQQFIHNTESEVIIAGWTNGGHGRASLRWLYEAVDGILDGVCHDIMKTFTGVKVEVNGNIQMNIESEQLGFQTWGFEVSLKIIQPRLTYRAKPVYPENFIGGFDVHLRNSKTVFEWSNGLWGFSEIQGSSTR